METIKRWVERYGIASSNPLMEVALTPKSQSEFANWSNGAMLERTVTELTVRKLVLEGQLQVYQDTYGEVIES